MKIDTSQYIIFDYFRMLSRTAKIMALATCMPTSKEERSLEPILCLNEPVDSNALDDIPIVFEDNIILSDNSILEYTAMNNVLVEFDNSCAKNVKNELFVI